MPPPGPLAFAALDRRGKPFFARRGGETVIRFKADADAFYDLPFELGVYDLANRQTVASKTWEKPLGPGYRWYSLGRVTLPERSFLAYATRKWTAQLPVTLPGMNGNAFFGHTRTRTIPHLSPP